MSNQGSNQNPDTKSTAKPAVINNHKPLEHFQDQKQTPMSIN